jgi:hypothetical protein
MVSGIYGRVISQSQGGVDQSRRACDTFAMTSILQSAIDKAKTLPSHRQDEVGQLMLAMFEQDSSILGISDAQKTEIEMRLSKPLDFVPDSEMNAFFRKLAG